MKRLTDGRYQWLQFDLLSSFPQIRHGSFLRHGNLDLNLWRGDSAVKENLQAIQTLLAIPSMRWANHQHGTHMVEVDAATREIPSCDALICRQPEMGLVIHHADCQAALFYDPVQKLIAAAHSGWRGSVQNLYGKLVAHLASHYGSHPADLRVAISPSLGPCHAQFIHYRTELPDSFWPYQVKPDYFDFWAISEQQLRQAGVRKEHIEMARLCTYAEESDCFSYRRNRTTARHGTVISINTNPS